LLLFPQKSASKCDRHAQHGEVIGGDVRAGYARGALGRSKPELRDPPYVIRGQPSKDGLSFAVVEVIRIRERIETGAAVEAAIFTGIDSPNLDEPMCLGNSGLVSKQIHIRKAEDDGVAGDAKSRARGRRSW
jgi:hypothetical protein